jgi:hypothetical protein
LLHRAKGPLLWRDESETWQIGTMRQMLSIYRAGQANRAATNWREIGWLAAAVAAFGAADRWFDIPIFFSAPAAFLSAVVYGYFAHERSTRRRAELIAAATVAWNEAEQWSGNSARIVPESQVFLSTHCPLMPPSTHSVASPDHAPHGNWTRTLGKRFEWRCRIRGGLGDPRLPEAKWRRAFSMVAILARRRDSNSDP